METEGPLSNLSKKMPEDVQRSDILAFTQQLDQLVAKDQLTDPEKKTLKNLTEGFYGLHRFIRDGVKGELSIASKILLGLIESKKK